jgi:hypothetical protein
MHRLIAGFQHKTEQPHPRSFPPVQLRTPLSRDRIRYRPQQGRAINPVFAIHSSNPGCTGAGYGSVVVTEATT